MSKVYKTCLFKVHNPSKRKQAMMLDSMRRADRAYWMLLDSIEEQVKALVGKDKKVVRETLRELKDLLEKKCARLPLGESAKNGLPFDVHAQASSYLELINVGQEASWPARRPKEDPYPAALEALSKSITLEELTAATVALSSKARTNDPRPLSVLRNDRRGTMLLEDDKGRLFAWINLHGRDSRFAKDVIVTNMANTRTGEIVNFKSKLGSLMPLECGQWHYERFIKQGTLQSSKLICRRGEFFLACTFEFETEDIECVTYLGIDRGIEEIASFAVITDDLELLDQGSFEGATLRDYQRKKEAQAKETQRSKGESKVSWRAYADHVIHALANKVVDAALLHASQVVIEDLSAIAQGPQHKRPKFRPRTNLSKVLNRAQYQKLANVLEYKLAAVGLPPPKLVRAAGTSITCNACGYRDKENRQSQAAFVCLKCGHSENADLHAAKNIAAKHIYWREVGPKVKGKKLTDKHKFENWLAVRRQAVEVD
jgi:putative transposase